MKKIFLFVLMFSMLAGKSTAQQVSLTGKVINPDEKPIKKVLVYLAKNPSLYCYSDTLGNFSLNDINTSVNDVWQDKIISFENRKLSLYANNQSILVDVITISGNPIQNILNLNHCLGTFSFFPEAYLSDLPKAIYIVRARVGNTFQSFKIQNIIPSGFPQGITEYDINNIIDNSVTDRKSEPIIETKSEALDTLVLVHDFYKSRKIPIDSYSIQYDTIHLNNFADYSIAEGFEPAVTYLYSGYGEFTNIHSEGDVQFIIDYDTLSTLEDNLRLITIPVGGIENLDNSIKFISGLHLEPSGTKFLQPVQVTVLLKDSIPKNLVVFHCDDQGETHYVPYVTHPLTGSSDYSVVFIINHFSSIGIGTVTGETNPPAPTYEEFTTSGQFSSYLDEYLRYYESLGFLEPPPIEFFTTWFNNVVAPMISSIITWEDFGEALSEFLLLAETCVRFGLVNSFTDLPFWNMAKEWFCEKMMKIWDELIVEYNRLNDYCLKRDILDIALKILEQNLLLGGMCTELSHPGLSDMNDFGNGEFFNLVNKIEFLKTVKHMEIEDTYLIEYNLKTISGNPPIPEVINWSSSNPSVASVGANGRVYAIKPGVAIITGRICDIRNTIKIEVGGVKCEGDYYYCRNESDSCYSGTYKCTGSLSYSGYNPRVYECAYRSATLRYTIVGSINNSIYKGYFETISSREFEEWNNDLRKCVTYNGYTTSHQIESGGFYCYGENDFRYDPSGYGEPKFYGYFVGKNLVIDAELFLYWPGLYSVTTKMHCVRIDK